jgi:CRP-like cAMP-binding protein
MRTVFDPRGNRLLAALPAADWQRWQPQLQWVDLPSGRTLHEPGAPERHLYFPVSAVVSLLGLTAAGQSAEVALVGNEGVVGVSLFMGDGTTPDQALVISGGEAYRLPAAMARSEFNRSTAVRAVLLRYTQSLMEQVSQTAVCNRHHTVDAQLCRWLLMCLDRVSGRELQMTQDLIAHMLGVRREGVTESALKLQRAGLIRYARGHIEVLDRSGLERRSCECYAVLGHACEQRVPELARA